MARPFLFFTTILGDVLENVYLFTSFSFVLKLDSVCVSGGGDRGGRVCRSACCGSYVEVRGQFPRVPLLFAEMVSVAVSPAALGSLGFWLTILCPPPTSFASSCYDFFKLHLFTCTV